MLTVSECLWFGRTTLGLVPLNSQNSRTSLPLRPISLNIVGTLKTEVHGGPNVFVCVQAAI